jgi:WD40 repeat protein
LAYAGTGGKIVVADVEAGTSHSLDACNKVVYTVAFNPQGSLLAAGCDDGSVRLWRWAASRWEPHGGWHASLGRIWAVAFDAGGTLVASAGRENNIKVMPLRADHAPDEADLVQLKVKTQGYVWSLAFSPVSPVLMPRPVLMAGDGVGNLWRCELSAQPTPEDSCTQQWKGDPEKKPGETDAVLAITFSPKGERVATGHWRGMVWLWDTAQRSEPKPIATRPSPVTSIQFIERNGALHLAYGADARLQTVPVDGEARSRTRSPMSGDDVAALAYHPGKRLLAAAMLGGYVAVVDTAESTSRVATRWPANALAPGGLKRPADDGPLRGGVVRRDREGTWFAIADADDLVLLVVPTDGGPPRIAQRISPSKGNPKLLRVSASASSERVVTLDDSGTLRFWRFAEERLAPEVGVPPIEKAGLGGRTPVRVILSNDGRRLVVGSARPAELLSIELREGRLADTTRWFAIHSLSRLREIALSADGKLLAVGGAPIEHSSSSMEDVVVLLDLTKSPPRYPRVEPMQLDPLASAVNELAFVTNRRGHAFVAAGGELGQINVWSADNGKALRSVRVDSRAVQQFAFSATQHLLAAADDRGNITLLQTDSWDRVPLSTGSEPAQPIGLLGFAGDEGVLVSGAHELTLWEVDLHSLHAKVCSILGVRQGDANPGLGAKVAEACAASAAGAQ